MSSLSTATKFSTTTKLTFNELCEYYKDYAVRDDEAILKSSGMKMEFLDRDKAMNTLLQSTQKR
ncbi:hypothetical protein O9G_005978 [Rozella allomycis CSF55]|uniref:Uncharacterized protein n=1 Tax=Rozella allomycis (strain CSF55) TaxID=988480 RepID=A0A075AVK3_ROZAC|nr:hypothetical protein O9G_005978 [Rozella allomycis CSF55]|eukprot:EPZ34155.1 hypothetical protein O9G_005978 [Rozella allomycis CSF55]